MSSLFWWCAVFGLTLTTSLASPPMVTLKKNASTKDYKNFLQELRNEIPDKTPYQYTRTDARTQGEETVICENIHVLPSQPKEKFILAEIEGNKGKKVTFAMRTGDVYLVAFKIGSAAFFLTEKNKGAPPYVPHNSIFTDVSEGNKKNVGRGDYTYLGDRASVPLGVNCLIKSVGKLADFDKNTLKDSDQINKELLVIIQMISEAARFKTIENEVTPSLDDPFKESKISPPSLKLENDWGTISEDLQDPVKWASDQTRKYLNDVTLLKYFAKVEEKEGKGKGKGKWKGKESVARREIRQQCTSRI